MRFAFLGSGSRGNAMVVEAGRTRLMIDCGFGPRNLAQRLERIGLVPADIDAILVTHEHSDHVAGVGPCSARHDIAVFATHGTALAMEATAKTRVSISRIDSHERFFLGDIEIQPFPVPHDAREPVQFVFSDGRHRLGLLTDTGHVTPHCIDMLSGCGALAIECNHDLGMLARGSYPPALKQRIAGRFGHLDNDASASLLAQLDQSRLQHVVAAHLSEQNNTPRLARMALAGALGVTAEWIGLASQDEGLDWREIR